MKKVLIIAQTPPPFGGQSINIGTMVAVLERHQLPHRLIRMNFSDDMNEMGVFSMKKLGRLFILLVKILAALAFYRPGFVYYPPAGPNKTPVLRDLVLLFPVRLFGFKRLFHYHAGGLSEIYPSFSPLLRQLYRFVYFHADHSICLSQFGTRDPLFLRSKQITILPSGVPDPGVPHQAPDPVTFTVLFAGVCRESKGVLDFLEVIRTCARSNPAIRGSILGKLFSAKEAAAIEQAVQDGIVSYDGVQIGANKQAFFNTAKVFLFPTFFEAENFPTVILEAFSHALPVVATQWRGIPDQVTHRSNGFLCPVHDIAGLASAVLQLAGDPDLYQRLSRTARHDFETKYTMGTFEQAIITFFKTLA